tara:strand:- start:50 stop:244 length:195 start_codon:yes stop_codon:yes gene_type:complete
MKKLILLALLISACSKDIEVCGNITGGDYDRFTDMYYLRIDGQKEYVDEKTYNSFFIGDYICVY